MNNKRSVVSLKTLSYILSNFQIPKLQRNLDEEHVASMIKDQEEEYKKHGCFSMLQSMTVASLKHGGNTSLFLLDGQHRVKAYSILKEKYPIYDIIIPVVEYSLDSQQELNEYYNRINKNMPIHPFETESAWADCGKLYLEHFEKKFGSYLKKSDKCHSPHISINKLKSGLHGRGITNKLNLLNKSVQDFWEKTLEVNEYIKKYRNCHMLNAVMKKHINDCEEKAKKNKCDICYLGVWKNLEWLDIALECLKQDKNVEKVKIDFENVEKRPFIPFTLREQVWKKYSANISDHGKCYTCNKDINFTDMECGHIKAHALGGAAILENLMPVCRTCNRDMGIMDLNEYKELLSKCAENEADLDCSAANKGTQHYRHWQVNLG